ncbi:hypothetical protein [Pontibacillus yanchengensis]|uniref:Uncharacterized protein n=1 Tax=Pontibacillus yanchengensis Y32 TaxID=1385514 RepID=A0A0A2TX81_9BACI|nr:hypothetical protein [Pontibacillus yanchengensis]KGP73835.1 hypothetical protein N782_01230 [Pontibacillus yanchengensis Y32]
MKAKVSVLIRTIFICIGFLVAFVAFAYNGLILSDIPISYTTSEAITSQVFFFIATGLLLIGLHSIQSNLGRSITASIFILAFLFMVQVVWGGALDATSNSSVVQLQLAPVLHVGLLLLVNVYLLIKNWNDGF